MTWKPTSLTRVQMTERRREGGRLLREGKLTKAQIARELNVSRAAVGQWASKIASGGLRSLKSRASSGRPPKLNAQQQRELIRHLKRGALAAGFATDRWTLPRIQQLIGQQWHITYHPNYLGRLLDTLGWSRQLPQARANERDDALVRAWLAHDWPRIKKSAAQRRHNRVFR
jgi:transposase